MRGIETGYREPSEAGIEYMGCAMQAQRGETISQLLLTACVSCCCCVTSTRHERSAASVNEAYHTVFRVCTGHSSATTKTPQLFRYLSLHSCVWNSWATAAVFCWEKKTLEFRDTHKMILCSIVFFDNALVT